jgi:hypothetical protein
VAMTEEAMMKRTSFPVGVHEELGLYVYRLIDPRNGETFYVGKGRGDRVFQHAHNALSATSDEDAADFKSQRIKEILSAGLDVGHVIHRHKIETDEIAFQIEAALIDAYPGLTNIVGGHGSGDYGVRHVEQIIAEYTVEPFVPVESLILISIGKSFDEEGHSIYDAVRCAWRINPDKANSRKLVLAQRRGVVVEAFRPSGPWIPATKQNFPRLAEDIPGRWGFEGKVAEQEVREKYVRRRVPDKFRKKGAAYPIRFVEP